MKYEDISSEEVQKETGIESVVYEPDVSYVVKNEHKILKNTLFYLAVSLLLVLNFVFILDMTSADFTSSIAQGVRNIFSGGETVSQNIVNNSSFVDFRI